MSITSKLKNILKKILYKAGKQTDRHIVVFESDDWGAVRNSLCQNF